MTDYAVNTTIGVMDENGQVIDEVEGVEIYF